MPRIAIVTVTLNASRHIAGLAESLANQTDQDFVWIVKDCCSSDTTISIVDSFKHLLSIQTVICSDTGIYDGLNQAIQSCNSPFYLTVGSDDLLCSDAIERLNYVLEKDNSSSDLYLNRVIVGKKIVEPGRGNGFFFGMQGFAANHSIGCLIRKDVHARLGYYSTKFLVASDSLFLYKMLKAGLQKKETGVVAGEFSIGGVSTSKMLFISHAEFALVQILNHPRLRFLQVLVYALRLLKNWRRY